MDWVLRTGANAEWVEGEIIMMAPSGPEQQDLNWWLCTLVRHYVDYKDLGIVLMDTFTRLTVPRQQVRAPDVLFVQKSRANIVVGNKAIGGAPDLIMEVVSHDSQARDWREKYHDYEAAGVREYWIIDPATSAGDVRTVGAGPVPAARGAGRTTRLDRHPRLVPEAGMDVARPAPQRATTAAGVRHSPRVINPVPPTAASRRVWPLGPASGSPRGRSGPRPRR
jgi:hypothetical protein